ncbi:cell division protein FtsZ [Cytophaga hutchinsonii]|jgi:cell division protein FtsZ|uniref:Cell division protein FtsZ n=1 Tax=Cytophaga hutchinsonii (strain ATCC 33406 / DSM 1761 / CIP 103989 / NBRC 15051 / NCIMB 9469 / D465) TaxID=269798 RepID=A0A6N4SU29_CYTH3|nr:cell division protein FtsZ [Cytophaga hutchinsonii]ABG59985.1 cell division protein FtsZ [Cytophaga hutchinsonii ATCC 33406]SFX26218.1 cell division protein FtsZ [Cytophaga hutchinsonii ATCC 33406]
MYKFDLPSHHKSIIKVIGVGGGGSNAVNHMYSQGIKDVEFIVCNTDVQALSGSPIPNKLQIGIGLTDGLGAGANPERGKNAAIESKEEIRELLSNNTKMVFITAGMGGGTGTGAAPIIAKLAKELDIVTVGIVTAPFGFEGKKKILQAEQGIEELRMYCDTVLVILNDRLRDIYGNLSIREAFAKADNILTTAAKSIAEIITVTSDVNVDFEDVKTVMKDSGAAVMGSGIASGEGRGTRAVEEALSSPLLNNTDITGAKKILLSIMYGPDAELRMDELSEIADYIEARAGLDQDTIWGQGVDPELGDSIRVTVIATGFEPNKMTANNKADKEVKKFYDLETSKQITIFDAIDEKKSVDSKVELKEDSYPKNSIENTSMDTVSTTNHSSDVVEPTETYSFEFTSVQKNPVEETVSNDFTDETEFVFEIKDTKPDSVSAQTPESLMAEEQRKKLIQQSQERIKRLKSLNSNPNIPHEQFKDMLDRPAFERKNVNLKDHPHSSDRNISRFNLNDDNEILGNNKFLHDNVD